MWHAACIDQGESASGSSDGTSDSDSSQASGSSSSSGGYQLSGSFSGGSLIAVGTMGPDGKLIPFSQQQIQSEEDAVATSRKSAYADALQNFMTLSQAGGQTISTSLTLKPVGGGVPASAT